MSHSEQYATQSKAVYLDPATCGSSVGYRIYVEAYQPDKGDTRYSLYAYVDLADCSHKIEWSFNEDGIEKIDIAIRLLQDFRRALAKTIKLYEKVAE